MRALWLVPLFVACTPSQPELGPGRVWEEEALPLSDPAPPPISGGTLLVSKDGTAWASDPDHDVVVHVDLQACQTISTTALEPGDEPGRIVEDATGRVHVILRRGGAVATIDPLFAQNVVRRSVCAEPRGIAYVGGDDSLRVTCTSGDLVTLPAAGGPETARVRLENSDLRDVVPFGHGLLISRFRSAQLLFVSDGGVVEGSAETTALNGLGPSSPAVAWRLVPMPDGGAVMTYQAEFDDPIGVGPGGYYGSIVETNVVLISPDRVQTPVEVFGATLPVDIAVSPDGREFALASAGSHTVTRGAEALYYSGAGLQFGFDEPSLEAPQPVAVAFDGEGRLVEQTREPYQISSGACSITSTEPSREHAGHEVFHDAVPLSQLACASCHPEGREDGHVWQFPMGRRRTQSLAGGLLGTEPFHWSGDLGNFSDLMDEVFVNRMQAVPVSPAHVDAVALWLDGVAAPEADPAPDSDAAERGRALFAGRAACTSCHAGDSLTNDQTIDVGTGGAFQVPSLRGVFARAPYMHDGCADTLSDRLTDAVCGGDAHGRTADLDEGEITDLVAYVETL